MSRSTFDADNDVPLPPHGRYVNERRAPCRQCSDSTLKAMLSEHGGLCLECFASYCRAPQRSPDIGDKRNGERDWNQALLKRIAAREPGLTIAQRDMANACKNRGVQRVYGPSAWEDA
jgi:hypothetical protein